MLSMGKPDARASAVDKSAAGHPLHSNMDA